MYENGPTGSIEASLGALAQGVIGSILVCTVLQEGTFTTMSAKSSCKEIGDMTPKVRRDQRR